MTSKTEAAVIRTQLKVRKTEGTHPFFNPAKYEVYTTVHGTGQFRWMMIGEETYNWYKKEFNLVDEGDKHENV